MSKRFIKFIFVGGLNTIVGYGTYALFLWLGIYYLVASTLSTIIGVINSYLLNKKITFNDVNINTKTPFKFASVYLVSYLAGLLNLFILVKKCNIDSYVAGFMNLFVTTSISWFGHRYFSFKEDVK